ncbi:MAG: hypothetical protein LBS60_12480 [Deltaproteobacteria bacterium]|jgi:hypothetical protein|nr:hypothetical protein [Deltaproteobacteria bacterium]
MKNLAKTNDNHIAKDTLIEESLIALLSQTTSNVPRTSLHYTLKSAREISASLAKLGLVVSHITVGKKLKRLGYVLKGEAEKELWPLSGDKIKQFSLINHQARSAIDDGQPVIGVETRKIDLIGERPWRQYRDDHGKLLFKPDYKTITPPGPLPLGLYDLKDLEGLVNVRAPIATSEFVWSSIYGWWLNGGAKLFDNPSQLYITLDDIGSIEYRNELSHLGLKKLANDLKLSVKVSHFPQGIRKWLTTPKRLFSFVASNWRRRPLSAYLTTVSLINPGDLADNLKVSLSLDRLGREVPLALTPDKSRKISGNSFFSPS